MSQVRLGKSDVAVVRWAEDDNLCEAVADELALLGHRPTIFLAREGIPPNADVVFSYGPYGDLLTLAAANARIPLMARPRFVHWHLEGVPDPRLPLAWIRKLAVARSWVGRVRQDVRWHHRVARLRYMGDYLYAHSRGWLDVLATSSTLHADLFRQFGVPAVVAPWGATRTWYADMNLNRDIDVLWLGARATRRRGGLLDRVRAKLRRHGIDIYVVDGGEHPFVFGAERTALLNRAKITLNLTRAWHDDNYSRFVFAASNRSLIVSEPLLAHCPEYIAGVHYVSAPRNALAETIVRVLADTPLRERIVSQAYTLVAQTLTLQRSVARIMDAVWSRNCDTNAQALTPGRAQSMSSRKPAHANWYSFTQ